MDQDILLSQQTYEVESVITPIYMWGNESTEKSSILVKAIEPRS